MSFLCTLNFSLFCFEHKVDQFTLEVQHSIKSIFNPIWFNRNTNLQKNGEKIFFYTRDDNENPTIYTFHLWLLAESIEQKN